jgi:hypothetical protein
MNTKKKCKKCSRELPATLEFFYESKIVKSGLRSLCKDCFKQDRLDHLASMTPEYRAAMKRAEVVRNRHVYREANRKRIAKDRGVYHQKWTEKELLKIYGSDCYLCRKPIDLAAPRQGEGSQYSLWPDHMIPTSRGGANTLKNVRPCHRACNQNKYNLTYEEYLDKADVSA